MQQNNYTNRSHMMLRGGWAVVNPGNTEHYGPLSEYDNENDLVYRGSIPSIVGKQITVVRVGHTESLIYCDRDQVPIIREKYQERFKRVAGVAMRDPKLPPLPRRRDFDIHGDEIDYLAMWADHGLDISLEEENDRLNTSRHKIKSVATGEDLYSKSDYANNEDADEGEEAPSSEMYERIMKGLNALTPNEMEIFRLIERGYRDTVISTTTGKRLETIRMVKSAILKKLRDYYGVSKSEKFFALIAKLYASCKKHNLPVPSDHYQAPSKSRGKYKQRSAEFSPGFDTQKPLESPVNKVFTQKQPEIVAGKFGPLEKAQLQQIEREKAIGMVDLGPVNGPDEMPVWENAPESEVQEVSAVSFNQFIEAYGNRKDAVKALNQFNKMSVLDRQKAFEYIPKYKAELSSSTHQHSAFVYLTSRSWTK